MHICNVLQPTATYCNIKTGEINYMSNARLKIKKICEHCGKAFEANKITTRYCSHECNRAAYKANRRKKVVDMSEELATKKKTTTLENDLLVRAYLSISEAAKLFGLSRWTIYRYVTSGVLPSIRITKRTTRIKRSDLDLLFENVIPYEIDIPNQKRKPITDWYTLDEITEKYGIKYRQIRKIINVEGIPEKKDGRFTLIARNRIDAYFKKRGYDESINNLSDWVTLSEVMNKYSMTETAAYSFLSDYNIPKKQQGGKRHYSKQHIDNLKNK